MMPYNLVKEAHILLYLPVISCPHHPYQIPFLCLSSTVTSSSILHPVPQSKTTHSHLL
ncbi:hypothetical protein BS17DRAFT_776651 [Gyrodon lividus]|nr:hypothetical protein BS17DRAFT_776651 [Gyrodon lividus]